MRPLFSRIIGIAALAGLLLASPAVAGTSVSRPTRTDVKRNLQITTLSWSPTLAGVAATSIDTCVHNVGPYMRTFIGATSVPTTSFVVAFGGTAATDSVNFALDIGPTASGPWKEVYAVNVNARTLYHATPFIQFNVVNTTIQLVPFWRSRMTNKSATAFTGKTFYLFFPALSSIPVQ